MTDDQLLEIKSDIKALTTQINWLVDDIDQLKTDIGDAKALLMTMMELLIEGGGSSKPQEPNWKVEQL